MVSLEVARSFNQLNTLVDIHAHPVLKTYLFDYDLYKKNENPFPLIDFNPFYLQVDIPKLMEGGVDVVLSTVYLPEAPMIQNCLLMNNAVEILKPFFNSLTAKIENNSTSDRPFEQTIEIIDQFEQKVDEAKLKGCSVSIPKDYSKLQAAICRGEIAFLHAIEGAHSLGRNHASTSDYLENLKALQNKGVCQMTLAHFYPNDVTFQLNGFPPTIKKLLQCQNTSNPTEGLTAIGEDVVREMLDIGMIVDLAHSTLPARTRVYEINNSRGDNKRPLVFSHNGVQEMFRDQSNLDKLYNPKKEEIIKISECNGVIGLIADNYWIYGEEEKPFPESKVIPKLLETIDFIHDVTGTYDNIAIGTDYDGFTDSSDDIQDPSELPVLTQALLNHIGSPSQVELILGGNALRVLREGWK
jgi:membrane dipeptidase